MAEKLAPVDDVPNGGPAVAAGDLCEISEIHVSKGGAAMSDDLRGYTWRVRSARHNRL